MTCGVPELMTVVLLAAVVMFFQPNLSRTGVSEELFKTSLSSTRESLIQYTKELRVRTLRIERLVVALAKEFNVKETLPSCCEDVGVEIGETMDECNRGDTHVTNSDDP